MLTWRDICYELRISRRTLQEYVRAGVVKPPTTGRGASYAPESIGLIRAARKLVHDDRVTLVDLAQREPMWKRP